MSGGITVPVGMYTGRLDSNEHKKSMDKTSKLLYDQENKMLTCG
jgi:hypothetical protein